MSSTKEGSAPKNDSFTFISFLQCSRHSKSGSNDSGISTSGKRINTQSDDVIVISDEDDSNEPTFDLLCEVKFLGNQAVPMPIEQKFICKTEPESLQESGYTDEVQSSSHPTVKEEFDTTANMSECEDELLPLCKEEHGDSALKNNNYILFICPQCGLDFDNSVPWKMHIDAVHNLSDQSTFNFTQRPNNKFQCNKCQAIITRCTLKTLQQHRFSHLPYKVYKCKLCRHEERSLYLMISHIMLHKEKEDENITSVQESASLVVRTSALEQDSKQFIAYICPVCGVSFDTDDVWQAHINFKHNFLEKTAENRFGDHFKCTECNVEIFSQHVADLQQHLFTHLPFKSFMKCKLCNWTISRRNFMTSHILNLHKTILSRVATSATAANTAHAAITAHAANTAPPAKTAPAANTVQAAAVTAIAPPVLAVATIAPQLCVDKLSVSLPCVFNYDEDDDVIPIEPETAIDKASTSMVVQSTRVDPVGISRIKGFRCTRCTNVFPTALKRNEHNVAEHGKYICTKCNGNFALKADMKRHNCTKKLLYECPQCFKEYNYEKCFNNHVRRCKQHQQLTRVRAIEN